MVADQRQQLDGWAAMTAAADVLELTDDGVSGKSLDRPALSQALAMLTDGEASSLVVTKLDRLIRSVRDLADLMDRSKREGWALVIIDTIRQPTRARH